MKTKGIDVSKWQGEVDFNKVRAEGYEFVIINAGFGRYISQKDRYFETNYKNARAAGLKVGAYWYSYAVNSADAKKEAETFLAAVEGKQFEYPLAYDIEDSTQSGLSGKVIGDMINAFCGHLESKGYYAAIYSYASFLKSKVPAACRSKYDVWVANFDVAKPDYPYEYGMWQYTSKGKVSGVSGSCDCDYAYKDYPAIMKAQGLNGFSRAKTVLDKTGYKKGDNTIGSLALKQLLLAAYHKKLITIKVDNNGVVGSGTEQAVNYLLEKWGYQPNSIAGEGFIKKLGAEIY